MVLQKINSKIFVLVGFIAAMIFMLSPCTAQATGISPGIIVINDAVANVPITKNFSVSRINTAGDEIMRLSSRGEGSEMITFPDGEYQLMKKGEGGKDVRFTITPGNIAAGKYKASVRAEQTQVSPEAVADIAGGGDVASAAKKSFAGAYNLSAAEISVTLNVTNKVIEKWEVLDHDLKKAEEDTPISFNLTINNSGSVATKPGKVDIKIREERGTEFLYNETVPGENLAMIAPFTNKPESVLTNLKLKIGRYYAYVKVYDRAGNLKYDSDKIFLEIVPMGTLAQAGTLKSLKVDKLTPQGADMPTYKPNEPVVIHGVFGNTGQVGVRTLLTVEVYKDAEKKDLLKSVEAFVPIAGTGDFDIDYKFPEEAIYTLKGYFSYGISKTNIGEVKVRVSLKAPEIVSQKSALKGSISEIGIDPFAMLPIIAAALLIICILLLFFYFYAKTGYVVGAACLWPDIYCQWPVCKLSNSRQDITPLIPTTTNQQKP